MDGRALQRPVVTPDGKFLASVTTDRTVHVIDLAAAARGNKVAHCFELPKSSRLPLRECHILRWSTETVAAPPMDGDANANATLSDEEETRWILLCNGRRLMAMSIVLQNVGLASGIDKDVGSTPKILADFDLGTQFGSTSLVEFVLDHRHVLLMFEFGGAAAILHVSKPRREEIPHIKFSDARSLASHPAQAPFALLRRNRGQDRVTVFQLGEDGEMVSKTFGCHTFDAQCLAWCPAGGPVLAVCDSPAHEVRVAFYTAQGHPLRLLDMTPSVFKSSFPPRPAPFDAELDGVGITHWKWVQTGHYDDRGTVEIAVDGQMRVLARFLSHSGASFSPLACFTQPEVVDGADTYVWQESQQSVAEFDRQPGKFTPKEAPSAHADRPPRVKDGDPATDQDHVDLVTMNRTRSLMATRTRSWPHALFLWKQHTSTPSPTSTYLHTVLVFASAVRQAIFHPYLPHLLLVLTSRKQPVVYAWYQDTRPPIAGTIPIDTSISTNFAMGWVPGSTALHENSNRCPFLLRSLSAYAFGCLENRNGFIAFDSLLTHNSSGPRDSFGALESDLDSRDPTVEIETPSRPGRPAPGRGDSFPHCQPVDDPKSDTERTRDERIGMEACPADQW